MSVAVAVLSSLMALALLVVSVRTLALQVNR
jgi:hypothetical protein